jgi:transposase
MTESTMQNRDLYSRIIQLFQDEAKDVESIARECRISQRTVKRYLDKWRHGVTVEDIQGVGRPRSFSQTDRVTLSRFVGEDSFATSNELARKMAKSTGVVCSPRTVRRTLKSLNYRNSIPKAIPMLTEAHKRARVEWANENVNRDWSKVVFSDETTIQLSPNICRAWHKKDNRPTCPRAKFPKKLMFWAAISRENKTPLLLVKGSVTAVKYVELLRDEFLPWMRRQKHGQRVFQQDNAPAHRARYTKAFFEAERLEVLPWPANSPDLNPIENLWGILKRNVDRRKPSNETELLEFAQDEWKKIPLSIVRACIDSMPRRLAEAITLDGSKTSY